MANASQNLSTEEELKRLLELKKVPDSSRTHTQQAEMDKLQVKHTTYSKLHADDMEKKLQYRPLSLDLSIQSPANSVDMSKDYTNTYANKPGFLKPTPQMNTMTLKFQSEEDAANFLSSQAGKGRKFQVLDPQNRVIAASNGKGVVKGVDGAPFKAQNYATSLDNTLQNRNQSLQQQQTMLQNRNQPLSQLSTIALQNRARMLPQQPQVNPNVPPRPLMTSPQSTVLMKNQAGLLKQPMKPSNNINMQNTPNNQLKNPRPTPFKKTPFDQ